MRQFNIKNFCVISHIDHGKSTLADRFLELTNTVPKKEMQPQYLDSMDLEKEKGITIKMHPVRLNYPEGVAYQRPYGAGHSPPTNYKLQTTNYQLNLIDTPGHVDFSYEISRALACVEGAVLLVDAVRGIQAQTLFNLEQAQKQGLKVIGVVNKIDLLHAQVPETKKELASILDTEEEEILSISAKKGTNVKEVLGAIIEKIPSPQASANHKPFRALIFDSKYDSFSGVIAYVRVFDGEIKKGDKIYLMAQKIEAEVKEVGYFSPALKPSQSLLAGEIGYIKTGIKDSSKVKVGDTITKLRIKNEKLRIEEDPEIEPLPGYQEPQSVLFMSLYPQDSDDFENLKDSLFKLKLNDPALDFQLESKMALGRGFRMGFLGSLHAEITIRRLKNEFNLDLIATIPQVVFQVLTKDSKEQFISSPAFWPDPSQIQQVKEPWVELELISPSQYFNQIFKLLKNYNTLLKETKSITTQKSLLLAEAPLREIIAGNFYDKLKSSTEGYASFSYKQLGFRPGDLVKLDILVASSPQEPLSRIVQRDNAFSEGKKLLQKLKQVLPPQQFSVALQACLSGKIIARETIRAQRKNVTAPLYGGDVTRKMKLLKKQKEGKKKLKERGKIKIPAQVFLEIMRS